MFLARFFLIVDIMFVLLSSIVEGWCWDCLIVLKILFVLVVISI